VKEAQMLIRTSRKPGSFAYGVGLVFKWVVGTPVLTNWVVTLGGSASKAVTMVMMVGL
jgi:hypothetical protein